jgi:hypothetical protein
LTRRRALANAVTVAAGRFTSFALFGDGSIRENGSNSLGSQGDGVQIERSSSVIITLSQ